MEQLFGQGPFSETCMASYRPGQIHQKDISENYCCSPLRERYLGVRRQWLCKAGLV